LEKKDLIYFREWFNNFCKKYYLENTEENKNILLKEKHSHFVSENAILIAKGESFGANHIMVAETAALFHDVGRFPQYARYKTFLDKVSVNHGQLGAETLFSEGILSSLSQRESDMIINSVRFHNAFAVPEDSDEETARFIRLVRDSDKIDIWRVFCEYYEGPKEGRADAVPLGLPESDEYSKEAIATINSMQVVKLSHVKTMTDLKLLQLSWIFDLNFRSSFRLARDLGRVSRMAGVLPETDDIRGAISLVLNYVDKKSA
jgi:hypothetical protein